MSNTIRIKRRAAGGAAGAPASLLNAELAYNETDDTLYYGKGTGGAGGQATQVLAIGGPGAVVMLNGSYADPAFITSLAATKLTGLNSTIIGNALGYTAENAANKGQANGYASLDAAGLVPASQLPSFVEEVLEFATLSAFPAVGETGKIYVTLDTNKTYRWGGSTYVEISASPGSTDAVPEGSVNLYFTTARARNSISVSGSLSYNATTGVISFTDAVTSVAGKTGAVTLNTADISGLGTMATQNANNVAITGGTIAGVTIDGGTF